MTDKELTDKLQREQEDLGKYGDQQQTALLYKRQAEILVAIHQLGKKKVLRRNHGTFKQWFAKRPTGAYTSDSLAQEVWDYFTEEKQ